MNILALVWSPGTICLQALTKNGDEQLTSINVPSAIGLHRYDLALYGGSMITLRLPGGSRSPFLCSRDGGRTFERLEAVPGDGALHPSRCRVHGNGTLTAIDGQVLWVRPSTPNLWLRHDLPEGLKIYDVSFDLQGQMHLVGAVPSTRLPEAQTEAAYALVEGDKTSFLQLALTVADAELLELSGGAEVFRQVDAEAAPILVTSDCAWQFEDSSSFILVYSNYHWRVRKLENQSIRAWIREGLEAVSVFTSEGRRYRTRDGGTNWEEQDLMLAVRRAWSGPQLRTPLVMAVASDVHLALAVSSYDWQAPPNQQLLGSAVLVSFDDGETFEVKTMAENPDTEFLGLLTLKAEVPPLQITR